MFKEFASIFSEYFTQNEWQRSLASIALILAAAVVFHFILFAVLKRVAKKSEGLLVNNIHQKFKTPSLILILIIGFNIVLLKFSPENILVESIKHIVKLLYIFSITWLVIRSINTGREMILPKYDIHEKDNLKARTVYTQIKIIERILIFLVVLISVAVALMTFDGIRNVGLSLFASAGVAGIILGFAAQKLIGSVLAGFQIAVAQPIRLDDVVIVENEWGWIEEITLTYVVVRLWDKRRLIVPTTYFIEKPFQNWTRVSADILGTVFIYTDYTVPIDKLREELTRVLKSDKNWDGKVNVLQVTNSTDKAIEIRALMSAADSPSAWDLRVNVREKLISYLQKNYPESLPKSRMDVKQDPTGSMQI